MPLFQLDSPFYWISFSTYQDSHGVGAAFVYINAFLRGTLIYASKKQFHIFLAAFLVKARNELTLT